MEQSKRLNRLLLIEKNGVYYSRSVISNIKEAAEALDSDTLNVKVRGLFDVIREEAHKFAENEVNAMSEEQLANSIKRNLEVN